MTAVKPITAPFDKALKIPYRRKPTYVFPDASTCISQAHQDRYPVLKDILQRNIESSPKLCDDTTFISYELRVCGSCAADAIPSILVFCPLENLKKIKSLFYQPHVRSQFESETTSSSSVKFGLFFWARVIDRLAFHEIAAVIPAEQATDGVVIDATSGRAPWGLRISNGDNSQINTATMGCMIQVGRDQFGLTTAHAFHQPLTTASGPDDSDSDDEEYDMSMERDDQNQMTLEVQPVLPIDGCGQIVRLGKCEVHIPPHDNSSTWTKKHADLDWALVKLGSGTSRPSIYPTATEALPIVDRLPQECVDVLIVTTSRPGIPATLYHIPSYIGGAKGSQTAEVWTVGSLSDQTRKWHNARILPLLHDTILQTLRLVLLAIQRGDSGAIVVDARSGELYGVVVAANAFGDIHIAPFAAILAQVKELFEVQDAFVLKSQLNLTDLVLGLPDTIGIKSLGEIGDTQEVVVRQSEVKMGREARLPHSMQEELLSEAGPVILHEQDMNMLAWHQDDRLRFPLSSQAARRTTRLPTIPKMEFSSSIMASQASTVDGLFDRTAACCADDIQDVQPYSVFRPTLSTTEDGSPVSQLHKVGVEDVEPHHLTPLTLDNLNRMDTIPLTRDVQSWVDGEWSWLRAPASYDQYNVSSFGRNDYSWSLCNHYISLDHVFTPAQAHPSFGRDALAIGTVFDYLPDNPTYNSDLELDEP